MINITRMFSIDEGTKARVYKDTKGNKTVGIGFNMDNPAARGAWIHADIPESFNLVYAGEEELSITSIWALLNACIDFSKRDLKAVFPTFDKYPALVQMGLLNLMFTLGKPKFLGFKTFISLINAGKFNDAAEDLKTTLWYSQVKKRGPRVVSLLKEDDSGYSV